MNTISRAWEEGLKTIRFLAKNGERSVPGLVVAVSVMKEIEIKLYPFVRLQLFVRSMTGQDRCRIKIILDWYHS